MGLAYCKVRYSKQYEMLSYLFFLLWVHRVSYSTIQTNFHVFITKCYNQWIGMSISRFLGTSNLGFHCTQK